MGIFLWGISLLINGNQYMLLTEYDFVGDEDKEKEVLPTLRNNMIYGKTISVKKQCM